MDPFDQMNLLARSTRAFANGRITLRLDAVRLKLEWDNWTEGSIEGPRATIEQLAQDLALPVTYAWRWSDYDENP